MVLNPFLNLLCQRLECRNIGGHNTGVSLYMYPNNFREAGDPRPYWSACN